MNKEVVKSIIETNGYIVDENTIEKNGFEFEAFTLASESGETMRPNIYLNNFEKSEMSDYEIAMSIISIYEANKSDSTPEIAPYLNDMKTFFDNIYLKLVYKHASGRLTFDVHIFRFELYLRLNDEMTISLTEALFDTVVNNLKKENEKKKFKDEMFKNAIKNTFRNEQFKSLNEVLGLYMFDNLLYILNYKDNAPYGAVLCASGDIMDDICDKLNTDKVVIIPSSIHEVLITPYTNLDERINEMITQVNSENVDSSEWLDDKAYVYTKNEGYEYL